MAKQFLTGLNLNKNELLNARVQNLASDPSSPVSGQIYYNTTNNVLKFYDGTNWLALAQGGSVTEAINAAINALTTNDIEEGANNLYYTTLRGQSDAANLLVNSTKSNITITGNAISGLTITAENGVADSNTDNLSEGSTNKYFTDERAQDAIANAIAAGTHSNITITYDDSTNKFTFAAENGVADSTTDNLSEGSTNLYFTNERAQDAIGNSVGTGLSYDDTTGAISVNTSIIATTSSVTNAINALSTTDIEEGTNQYFTEARARTSISAGDNSLTYNSVSGVLTANTSTLATRAYVDSTAQGLDVKASVRAATTTNISLGSGYGPATPPVIDGVSINHGDRVLIKNQSTASENGIYTYSDVAQGFGRAFDANDDAEVTAGMFTFVAEGTVNADSGWVLTTNDTITLGTTALTFTQFSGAGQITAGAGLTKTGNTLDAVGTADRITVNADSIDISATYAGQTSIVTLGTVATGTWQGNAVAVAYGGTGATTAAGARSNLGATTKYAVSNTLLEPTSNVVTWAITHSLNTEDVTVQMRELSSDALVEADVVITNANTVTISWTSAANVNADVYRAVVVG
jgi:hypothetical protein